MLTWPELRNSVQSIMLAHTVGHWATFKRAVMFSHTDTDSTHTDTHTHTHIRARERAHYHTHAHRD